MRKPFLIPKTNSTLQEMEVFIFVTAIDLNIGCYAIRLDPDTQHICTIIQLCGKHLYLRLPMGISGGPDIFQEKMSELMRTLEYVRTCICDLLVIMMGTYYDNHLDKVDAVLDCLRLEKLCVNAKKSHFVLHEIRYLGYNLPRDGIKPQPETITAILTPKEPQNVK